MVNFFFFFFLSNTVFAIHLAFPKCMMYECCFSLVIQSAKLNFVINFRWMTSISSKIYFTAVSTFRATIWQMYLIQWRILAGGGQEFVDPLPNRATKNAEETPLAGEKMIKNLRISTLYTLSLAFLGKVTDLIQ